MSNTSTDNEMSQTAGYWFEDMPLTKAHVAAGLAIFVTFVIEAWEMLIVIFSAGMIGAEFDLDTKAIGTLISAIFLGMIPGSIIWGQLSSTIGRRKCLILSIGLYAVFPILSALSTSYGMLWWTRFFAGVVLAGALVVSFPLFMEHLPVKIRGRATVLLSAGWPVGTLIAVGVASSMGDMGWRWILGFSTIAASWAIVVYIFVPESAYWLAEKGKGAEAGKVVSKLTQGQMSPEVIVPSAENTKSMPFTDIFKGATLKITIISTIVNFSFAWGYWGMTSWLPTLLAEKGLNMAQGFGFIALSACFMFPGYLSAAYLTGRIGRKKVMVIYVAMATVAGIGFAYASNLPALYIWNFTLSFFSLGGWGIWNTWQGEVYSTATRGPGVAWGVMLQRVANTIAPIVIGFVLAASGFTITVLFISAFLAITLIAVLFLKETEGQRLT